MNKELQIEAMARCDGLDGVAWRTVFNTGGYVNWWFTSEDIEVPDYHTDNEIDRMVRGIKEDAELNARYNRELRAICDRDNTYWTHLATAEQKVEAYLKATNNWEETK
jgi:hypothetical protein